MDGLEKGLHGLVELVRKVGENAVEIRAAEITNQRTTVVHDCEASAGALQKLGHHSVEGRIFVDAHDRRSANNEIVNGCMSDGVKEPGLLRLLSKKVDHIVLRTNREGPPILCHKSLVLFAEGPHKLGQGFRCPKKLLAGVLHDLFLVC